MNTLASGNLTNEKAAAPRVTFLWMLLRIVVYLAFLAAILFGAAGRLDWVWGWMFLAVYLASMVVTALVVPMERALIDERTRIKKDVKSWDKVIATVLSVVPAVAYPLLAGLDSRFGWSPPIAPWLRILALALFALGMGATAWVMRVNKFFARYVRIQKERGHTVVTSGPYRFVRHPGYAFGIVNVLVMPLALGSLWALILGAALVALIVVRITLEERALKADLPDYEEYTQQTRYRLLPGVW